MQLGAKMDDGQIAEAFHEDILTTKIMKHFMRRAGMVHSFLAGLLVLDATKLITLIDIL